MLGIPLGTVKTLLFCAKKELLKMAARRRIGGRRCSMERPTPCWRCWPAGC
jgi:hypothetical protein